MLKAVFFDLDGTLLPLNEEEFTKVYFGLLCKKMIPYGYKAEELVKVIWSGTKKMYENDGSKTNETVFWNEYASYYGKDKLKHKPIIDDYYKEEFKQTKACCKENPYARKIIEFCKKNNIKVFLTTNPIFPKIATITRMSYVDLKESDFEYISTYENSIFTKPNPLYFSKILLDNNLNPEEVILFGNNTYEDGECSYACGIKCYMVGDYLINHPKAKHTFIHISMNQVIDTIKREKDIKKE